MLKKMMELGCHLLDYELVKDDSGRRLIFFGRHAGLAGMINTLWAYGKRMEWEGVPNPFSEIKLAHQYSGLEEAKAHIFDIGERIWKVGLPQILTPFICGFTGYGHVSQGAQEIFDLLPNQEITPEEIISVSTLLPAAQEVLIKVVFKEQDMFVPLKREEAFDLQDYYDNPHKYRSRFEYYLPHLSIMVNCIYWSNKYPRLVTNEFLKKAYSLPHPQFPKVIGDISCDIEGSVQCTVKATNPGAPVFVYNPLDATVSEGFEGFGPVIMAVDNLPCEIPQESSQFFSDILTPFIPQLAKADFNHSGKELNLSPELVRSIILHQGKLIPEFQYLQKYL
jgi:alpha-aminoadipic semialdehyde synthase